MNDRTQRWLRDLVDQAEAVERLVARGKDAYDAELLWAILSTNIPQVAARVARLIG